MIEFLKLHRLGIIDDAHIELGPGLTVITGETGAGKTMVLSALRLLLGGKSDQGLAASKETSVQGGWLIDPTGPVATQLAQAGVELLDGEFLLTRTMPSEGRSRCSANGTIVPQALVAACSEDLIAVHGQSDQTLLRRSSKQRDVLDRFGGAAIASARDAYFAAYAEVTALDEIYQSAVSSQAEQAAELTSLREQLEQIEAVSPVAGEDDALAETALCLGNLSQLQAAAASASQAIAGEDDESNAVTAVHSANKALEGVAEIDPALKDIYGQLREVALVLNEVGVDLSRYLADLDADPGELERIQSRRAELTSLTRRYGSTVQDVITWSQQAAARVEVLEQASNLVELAAKRDKARAKLATAATALTAERKRAGREFCVRVTTELQGLAMPHSQLGIAIRHRQPPAGQDGLPIAGLESPVAFGASGVDEVEFLLLAHEGATPAPIGKAASGGELSRIMLALEVVLSESASAPTFVFDEVDAGVGGKAAVEIGRRLAQLGKSSQVLVVTHLPQVAAFADHHLVVSKQSDGRVTSSGVESLDDSARVRELARMLAGQEESAHAAAHAQELLDLASLERDKRSHAVGKPSK